MGKPVADLKFEEEARRTSAHGYIMESLDGIVERGALHVQSVRTPEKMANAL